MIYKILNIPESPKILKKVSTIFHQRGTLPPLAWLFDIKKFHPKLSSEYFKQFNKYEFLDLDRQNNLGLIIKLYFYFSSLNSTRVYEIYQFIQDKLKFIWKFSVSVAYTGGGQQVSCPPWASQGGPRPPPGNLPPAGSESAPLWPKFCIRPCSVFFEIQTKLSTL